MGLQMASGKFSLIKSGGKAATVYSLTGDVSTSARCQKLRSSLKHFLGAVPSPLGSIALGIRV